MIAYLFNRVPSSMNQYRIMQARNFWALHNEGIPSEIINRVSKVVVDNETYEIYRDSIENNRIRLAKMGDFYWIHPLGDLLKPVEMYRDLTGTPWR